MPVPKASETPEELIYLRRRVAQLEDQLQHRLVLGAIPDAVVATDAEGWIRYWNEGARELYGHSAEDVVGRSFDELVQVDQRSQAAFGADPSQVDGPVRVHRKQDGSLVWVEISESRYQLDDAHHGFVYVCRDVTRRSRAETELRQIRAELERRVATRTAALAEAVTQLSQQVAERERAEAEMDQFFRTSPSLMMVVHFDGAIERINPAFASHLESEPAAISGQRALDYIHRDDAPSFSEQMQTMLAGHNVLGVPMRTVARSGRVRWVELSGAAVSDRRVIFFSGVDITSRRQTDQALRDSEQRFRELAENVSEVFWLAEPAMQHFVYASPAFEPLWGRRVSDLVQSRRHWVEAIHPDDRDRAEQAFRHLVEEGDMDVEYRIIRPDGSQRWIHDRGYPVMSETEEVARVAGIASDITDRKQAMQAMQAVALGTASASTGDQFFQTLMRHVATALRADDAWLTEPADEGTHMRVLGWWSEGRPRDDKILSATKLPCLEVMDGPPLAIAHGAARMFRHELLSGREAFLAQPLSDASGRILGVLAVARAEPLEDLAMVDSILQIFAARATAELERLRVEARVWQREEELAHVGRLQTMGEMASGIAHELNQPLLAIMNHAAAARLGLSTHGQEQVAGDLNDIELQAERAAEIIQRLRSFVQRHPPVWAPININALVGDVLRFMRMQAQRLRCSMISDLDPSTPTTTADRILLEQVLVNLISNALEAIQNLPEDERRVTVRTEAYETAVLVAVDDPGSGPESNINLFEPFVSTKADGLGIGLSISRSIIERHQGYLWHEPRHPRGCRFAFRLPLETEAHAIRRTP